MWATSEQTRAAVWQADLLATPLARALTAAATRPANEFAAFDEPRFAKVVWTLEVSPSAPVTRS